MHGAGLARTAPPSRETRARRRPGLALWTRLTLLGLVGVASLLYFPVEQLVPVDVDPMLLRLASTAQPALFVLAFAAIGLWAAPKVGLDAPAVRAWAEGRPVWPTLRPGLRPALVTGFAVAAILVALFTILPGLGGGELLRFSTPLITRLLYGGITEELLMRWGLMSLIAWTAWRLAGRPTRVPAWCLVTAAVASALLFAVGHLPLLTMLAPDAPVAIVLLVLVCNFVPGLLFGWLFWRRGLESAMVAHAFAHLVSWTVLLAV